MCLHFSILEKKNNSTFAVFAQIIEKRRRDRINNSLSELRRLVPSAYEKQVRSAVISATKPHCGCSLGLLMPNWLLFSSSALKGSAKLEKAEILQMTVDHLKMLHASGGKGIFLVSSVTKKLSVCIS